MKLANIDLNYDLCKVGIFLTETKFENVKIIPMTPSHFYNSVPAFIVTGNWKFYKGIELKVALKRICKLN